MPTFTPNLKYDNIMEYRLSSHSGDLFFDLKENNEEQYLKITQSKNIGSGNFRRDYCADPGVCAEAKKNQRKNIL